MSTDFLDDAEPVSSSALGSGLGGGAFSTGFGAGASSAGFGGGAFGTGFGQLGGQSGGQDQEISSLRMQLQQSKQEIVSVFLCPSSHRPIGYRLHSLRRVGAPASRTFQCREPRAAVTKTHLQLKRCCPHAFSPT